MAALPFKVKAVHEYQSPHEDDLSFPTGQIITVTEEEDEDWYVGEYISEAGSKTTGLFPKNHVERYEPETPPRPVRARPKKETTPAPEAAAAAVSPPSVISPTSPAAEVPAAAPVPVDPVPAPMPTASKPQVTSPGVTEPAKAAPTAKSPPPAVAEKPSSFKDRIAAFNKPAQPPLAPTKPGALSAGTGFIKKPFVAPPPSRDAYVPPPRAPPPQKLYRREEDPEIAERQAQDQADAEKAGLAQVEGGDEQEEAPKQSLKDRIAMLQKQQMEQAARRAEFSSKEKPKKPAKKRTTSGEQAAVSSDLQGESTSLGDSNEAIAPTKTVERGSFDQPPREIMSDENDADQSGAGDTTEDAEGTSTSVEENDEKPRPTRPEPTLIGSKMVNEPGPIAEDDQEQDHDNVEHGEEEDDEGEEEEEEDEMDAETRRKMELRERMAKMSGGMGMPGMFGGGMPLPRAAPPPPRREVKKNSGASDAAQSPPESAPLPPQRLPIIPPRAPVRTDSQATEIAAQRAPERVVSGISARDPGEIADVEDLDGTPQDHSNLSPSPEAQTIGSPPPPPSRRAVPPVPSERPLPPPPPHARAIPSLPVDQSQASDSGIMADDEMPPAEREAPARAPPPPIPGAPKVPSRNDSTSQSAAVKRSSTMPQISADSTPATSPRPERKGTGFIPPLPIGSPQMSPPAEVRAPPPPPPSAVPPSRPSMDQTDGLGLKGGAADDEGESDYEGDYDTDIAPGSPHNHALKALAKDTNIDDAFSDTASPRSSSIPPGAPPPIPPAAQRAPPPPPPQVAPASRASSEIPRAPPPIPPSRERTIRDDDEYDPYSYTAPLHGVSSNRGTPMSQGEDPSVTEYFATSPPVPSRPVDLPPRPADGPPIPQSFMTAAAIPSAQPSRVSREIPRQPFEAPRSSMSNVRRSGEAPRASTDQGYIAQDIDLSSSSSWWAEHNLPPPALQNRSDILYEMEESTSSKRGGRTTVSKDVYVLYQDYSQTIITVRFDSKNVGDVAVEQRHEPPPGRPRPDQLENAHDRFGAKIAEAASSLQNTTVGDGSANALVVELLRPLSDALLPVGTRAYGALVYANLGNATVQQYDQIRSGDIITFRNAKFQGKHGAMHQKYSQDVGKPEHVAVVVDWDGTKKKIRAWEQGRDNKKVKMESFRMGDLKTGEVKVWRVMSRGWVGWEGSN